MTLSPIDLGQAYRVLNPGCVVLVSVGDGERDNLFAVTWNMPVRKDPPLVALVSGKAHFSYPIIERTGELGINVVSADLADALYGCGTVSGSQEPDKWARFGLGRAPATRIDAPLVAEALASLECRVCQVVDLGSSALLVAQVVAASADPRYFGAGGWRFEEGLRLLHHLSGPAFAVSGEELRAKAPPKRKAPREAMPSKGSRPRR